MFDKSNAWATYKKPLYESRAVFLFISIYYSITNIS